jgi:hypothetical protein
VGPRLAEQCIERCPDLCLDVTSRDSAPPTVFYRALRADERTTRVRVVTNRRVFLPRTRRARERECSSRIIVRARRERDSHAPWQTGVPYSEPEEVFVKTAMIPVSSAVSNPNVSTRVKAAASRQGRPTRPIR